MESAKRRVGILEIQDVRRGTEVLEAGELSVSFGYQCNMSSSEGAEAKRGSVGCLSKGGKEKQEAEEGEEEEEEEEEDEEEKKGKDQRRGPFAKARSAGSFACFSGAALGANATLANTALGRGRIGQQILPGLDSPREFRPIYGMGKSAATDAQAEQPSPASPAASASASSSSDSYTDSTSPLYSASAPQSSGMQLQYRRRHPMHMSYSMSNIAGAASCDSGLMSPDVRTAGGAAGEDRVQAFYSEEDGWLFCAIYDGFNGRDAADFLAGTLYDNISFHLMPLQLSAARGISNTQPQPMPGVDDDDSFHRAVLSALQNGLADAEREFMHTVHEEVDERAELAMVGSCVLVVLLHANHLYTLNLGDSRAVLATSCPDGQLQCVQLTQDHTVADAGERARVLAEHPDDPSTIASSRVKGKIKLTRAFGAAYLKKAELNDKMIGLLRVRNLVSPPYVSSAAHVQARRVCAGDSFVVIASDGLFDYFSNHEVVHLLHRFMAAPPPHHDDDDDDPAKYMIHQLLLRAASHKGITLERLKSIPLGRRRKYHDDVTIMVVTLGADNLHHRTCTASTNNS